MILESKPEQGPENKAEELKQRFQKRQEERKESQEVNWDALSDDDVVREINRGREAWAKRRAEHLKKLEELDSRVNSGSTAPASRRGRKPGTKNNAGD